MTESKEGRTCLKCGSAATYRVAMCKDDESGLRVVGGVMRHVCAICGYTEVCEGDGSVSDVSPKNGGSE